MHKRILTQEEQLDICTRYQNGGALYTIGREYKTQTPTLEKMLLGHGIPIRPSKFIKDGKGSYKLFTDEQLNGIVESYKECDCIRTVAKRFHVSSDTINRWLKRKGVDVPSSERYYCDRSFFSNIDTQEKAYVLGLIMSDGCISHTGFWYISLKEEDKEILEKVKLVLRSKHPINIVDRTDEIRKWANGAEHFGCRMAKLCIGSVKMVKDLGYLGIGDKKSLVVPWPIIPYELNRHMLRGIFDGDGSISIGNYSTIDNPTFKIISGSEKMLHDCQKYLVEKLKLTYTKFDRSTGCPTMVYCGRENCRKIYHLMYDNATIYIERKRSRFNYLYEPNWTHDLTTTNLIYRNKQIMG